nr:hypothetical protein [Tanacetum cinerariifolium]
MKSGIKSINDASQFFSKLAVTVNTARLVNTAHLKTTMNAAKSRSRFSNSAHSIVKRPIQSKTTFKNSFNNQRVNTVRNKQVNTARPKAVLNVKGNCVNAVKASACWVWRPKHKVLDHVSRNNGASMSFKIFDYGNPQQDLKVKGVIDSGCSRHMTENRSYLTDYEELIEDSLPLERDMSKVKCYNCKKERHFAKDCKKAKVKDYNYYKTKMLLAKKDSDEQVLLAEDQAWMESSSDSYQEINANMVFMA